jgi:CRP/FNR family cyclic AMP-dependent transcriptional regulator
MNLNDELDLLRKIPLLSKVHPSKLKLLAFTSERLRFEPGQDLFVQGDRGDEAFLIVEGEAQILVNTDTGPIEVARVKKNAFIGEIAILCDVHTLKIKKEQFFTLVEEFPEMAVEIMRELARRVESTTAALTKAHADLKVLRGD